ncbi:MAG: acylneuraminate cytidylyltransferase family protein [Lachnospiraceae bacterium]|nr:acylneuraminate cytidylyltransferase family protein [Lachnospiraceae bacterium]
MKNLAIIPARSGSKGVTDKNIRELCGKPLMAYTIEAALISGEFEEVMVSTDSEHYADIARSFGAEVPFMRSVENATDTASSWDMVAEVLQNYGEYGREFETFCLLQPTSPLRSAEDIRAAYRLYREKAEVAVVSVCRAEHSPLWCAHLPEDQSLDGFIDAEKTQQRQSCGVFYRLNGAIYIVNTTSFSEDRYLYRKGSYAYRMDERNSVDIDTELDFEFAELLMKKDRK